MRQSSAEGNAGRRNLDDNPSLIAHPSDNAKNKSSVEGNASKRNHDDTQSLIEHPSDNERY